VKDIERMVVSAHVDGEVESPWKEQIEQRLASDPAWAAEAELHRGVKAALLSSPEPDWTVAQARIKSRSMAGAASRSSFRSLPLAWVSVAAAALLVFAVGSGYWLGRQSVSANEPTEVAEIQVQVPKALGLQLSGEGQLIPASTLQRTGR
jgi:anti-sigma factor RsiW